MTYNKSPEQIQDEIAITRARMEARISHVTQQASPLSMASNMLNVNGANSTDMLSDIVQKAKANPFAALAIGAGLLGFSNSETAQQSSRLVRDNGTDFIAGGPARRIRERSRKLKEEASSGVSDFSETAADYADEFSEAAEDYQRKAKETAAQAKARAERYAEQLKKRAAEIPQTAKYEAENATAWVKANPLPASLMALAAGAALASFFAPKKSPDEQIRHNRALVPTEDTAVVPSKAETKKAPTQTRRKTPRKPRTVKVPTPDNNVMAQPVVSTKPARRTSTKIKPVDEIFSDQ